MLLLEDWLNENLPDLLNVWISLKRDINWNKDSPFSFNKARLARVSGKVNKYFPPIANKTARKINPIKIKNLKPLDNFFEEILLINFKTK